MEDEEEEEEGEEEEGKEGNLFWLKACWLKPARVPPV